MTTIAPITESTTLAELHRIAKLVGVETIKLEHDPIGVLAILFTKDGTQIRRRGDTAAKAIALAFDRARELGAS